jgi:hypothetical protein
MQVVLIEEIIQTDLELDASCNPIGVHNEYLLQIHLFALEGRMLILKDNVTKVA